MSFHKLLIKVFWNFGSFLLTELGQDCKLPDESSLQKFFIKRFVLQPLCDKYGGVLGAIVHLEDLHIYAQTLTFKADVFRCFFYISTWCSSCMMSSILWAVAVFLTAKYHMNIRAPPLLSWNGVISLTSFPLFLQMKCLVIRTKHFKLIFIRPQDISPKN